MFVFTSVFVCPTRCLPTILVEKKDMVFQGISFLAPQKAPGPPKKLRNHCAGCGLAWSSGIFRQLVHAKQLRSAGYVESGEKWEYKGEGLTKWYWLMDRILWAAAKIANIQLKKLKKVINHTQK